MPPSDLTDRVPVALNWSKHIEILMESEQHPDERVLAPLGEFTMQVRGRQRRVSQSAHLDCRCH